jgi:hypothetical protein
MMAGAAGFLQPETTSSGGEIFARNFLSFVHLAR